MSLSGFRVPICARAYFHTHAHIHPNENLEISRRLLFQQEQWLRNVFFLMCVILFYGEKMQAPSSKPERLRSNRQRATNVTHLLQVGVQTGMATVEGIGSSSTIQNHVIQLSPKGLYDIIEITCPSMFSAALVTKTRKRKHPRRQSNEEWENENVVIYILSSCYEKENLQ